MHASGSHDGIPTTDHVQAHPIVPVKTMSLSRCVCILFNGILVVALKTTIQKHLKHQCEFYIKNIQTLVYRTRGNVCHALKQSFEFIVLFYEFTESKLSVCFG